MSVARVCAGRQLGPGDSPHAAALDGALVRRRRPARPSRPASHAAVLARRPRSDVRAHGADLALDRGLDDRARGELSGRADEGLRHQRARHRREYIDGKLAEAVEPLRAISAFRYYGSAIQQGFDLSHAIGLTLVAVVLTAAGAVLFDRRDVR